MNDLNCFFKTFLMFLIHILNIAKMLYLEMILY